METLRQGNSAWWCPGCHAQWNILYHDRVQLYGDSQEKWLVGERVSNPRTCPQCSEHESFMPHNGVVLAGDDFPDFGDFITGGSKRHAAIIDNSYIDVTLPVVVAHLTAWCFDIEASRIDRMLDEIMLYELLHPDDDDIATYRMLLPATSNELVEA